MPRTMINRVHYCMFNADFGISIIYSCKHKKTGSYIFQIRVFVHVFLALNIFTLKGSLTRDFRLQIF
jgi:hypothetical protein